MLNPAFSREFVGPSNKGYQLSDAAIAHVRDRNAANNTGTERRTQKVFGDELWRKLKSMGLDSDDWQGKSVLDVCCGTGFLSYHLVQRVSPARLVLMDISPDEMREARSLVSRVSGNIRVEYLVGDALVSGLPDDSFDVIIGNSFLHHFYDVPKALEEFRRLLKPGGVFVSLHEPTEAAIPLEGGSVRRFMKYLLSGSKYIDSMRYRGSGIAPQGGTDVWIFQASDMRELTGGAGFVNIRVSSWNLLRPLVVAMKALHLMGSKHQLSGKEIMELRIAIAVDAVLRLLLPQAFFGSVCVAAEKPEASL